MTDFQKFSRKQKQIFYWWQKRDTQNYSGIICDGAVRSGKTVCMSLSFVLWAFSKFENKNFALCGKTLNTLKRNVTKDLLENIRGLGYRVKENNTQNFLDISDGKKANRFYLFSGNNEGSAARIQGVTLAGVLFDEVALMPQSFVNQTIARCSHDQSTFWFNCNPEHPYHWFYLEWILKREQKNLLYLQFTMDDNPSLSNEVKERYQKIYSGPFYERYVLGEWSASQGAVYPNFSLEKHCFEEEITGKEYYISCDYGIQNPFSLGLYTQENSKVYRLKEWYYSGRDKGVALTDQDYYQKLKEFSAGYSVTAVVVDPSASSFISLIQNKGEFQVIPAKNDVINGIGLVTDLINQNRLFIHKSCENCLREFHLYKWSEKAGDKPQKENDHTMDELRYFVATIVNENDGNHNFFVLSSQR